jgi:hypothetical protein
LRIELVTPPPPPKQVSMTFPRDDAWAIIAALREYADRNKRAVHREDWIKWASDLDELVRR